MWVEPSWGHAQLSTEGVDILGKGRVHLQGPLSGHLLGLATVQAGASENQRTNGPVNAHVTIGQVKPQL